jgi:hypothetical protein
LRALLLSVDRESIPTPSITLSILMEIMRICFIISFKNEHPISGRKQVANVTLTFPLNNRRINFIEFDHGMQVVVSSAIENNYLFKVVVAIKLNYVKR